MAYRLLAAVVVAALLAGSGFVAGRKIERAGWLERSADIQNAALESARRHVELAKERAIKEARREAVASAVAEQIRRRGLAHASNADPACRIDDESFRLYVDAVRSANSSGPD